MMYGNPRTCDNREARGTDLFVLLLCGAIMAANDISLHLFEDRHVTDFM